ncbi:MAG: geranylgeranylglyceryl/heptaprenylglyceryl phosphate synthase, partial [Flavobacteriales bacterium]|nr:geranylgeranylglyceryl/heptaprenylglyceryl phosphate synthase [Flavobacteriales bacterium]
LAALATQTDALPDLIFVGGSLVKAGTTRQAIEKVRGVCDRPIVLFPGSILQVDGSADALFFLSLISGRNPEMLIGNHVVAAPMIRQSGLEVLPTGYLLVDGGQATAVSYISNTFPIPRDKNDIAACTAMAGEMLGLRNLYMDAGSGALHAIEPAMISAVREHTSLPIIVGGGIKTEHDAINACQAGADVVVVGNAIEANPNLLSNIVGAVRAGA